VKEAMNFSCAGSESVEASKRQREELPENNFGKGKTEQDMDNKLAWFRFFTCY
jgi:hypothetical protein